MKHVCLLSILCLPLASCALGGSSPDVRYYSAAAATVASEPATTARPAAASAAPGGSLRMRRTSAAGHLGQRMAWRADAEYGFREHERWTELPAAWVERALSWELFERHGRQRREAPGGATVDVELLAFEEIRGPEPRVRTRLHVRVLDTDYEALHEGTVTVERPLASTDADAVARALSNCLAELARRTARQVLEALDASGAGPGR